MLSAAGYPKKHGRYAAVSRMADVSASGAKVWFESDHPPRDYAIFDRLLSALVKGLEEKSGFSVSLSELEDYLLNNRNDPLTEQAAISHHNQTQAEQVFPEKRPHVYTAQLYDFINQVARDLGINLFRDFDLDRLEFLYSKIADYCHDKNIDLRLEQDKDHLKDIIGKLLELARKNVL